MLDSDDIRQMVKKNTPTPTDEDRKIVAKLWSDENCPYFDLIMFADGRILELCPRKDSLDRSETVAPGRWMLVSEIPNPDALDTSGGGYFATMCRCDVPELDLSISAGECASHGGNGFVAVTSLSTGEFKWLGFFLESNPFDGIKVKDQEIIASSTTNKKYHFPLEHPEQVRIEH